MTAITAPTEMTRREFVGDLLTGVPKDGSVATIIVEFGTEQFPTTSFVDELIRQILHVNVAEHLVLCRADQFTTDLAERAAARYDVTDRLTFEPNCAQHG